MDDLDRRLRRDLAARAVRPMPPTLPDRVLAATTRRRDAGGGEGRPGLGTPARPASARRFPRLLAATLALAVAVLAAAGLGYPALRSLLGAAGRPAGPSGSAPEPPLRTGPALAYDAQRGVVVLFGGTSVTGAPGAGAVLDDTWIWDGRAWREARPAHRPPARSDAAMAFDVPRHVAVLFGGHGSDGTGLGDTWVWDGHDWFPQRTVTAPVWDASQTALAYDPGYSQLLLVTVPNAPAAHTRVPAGTPGATWAWDGQSWHRLSLSVTPPLAASNHLALDRPTGRLVLYTSPIDIDVFLAPAPQTWTWGAGGWVQVSPPHQPGDAASLVTDPRDGRAQAFNGNEIWKWTGTDWTLRTAPGPFPCCDIGDPQAGVVLHFGRSVTMAAPDPRTAVTLSSTWTWDGLAWTRR
ncbi:MAG TPA: hypothetical protein VG245_09015 [Candidatus Dormibacteraeota bacterium]|jgi:hypothetical protein|nr:hypothetical protein [Candidatus Dormibacteraeota bacterium]